jgi:hypothetical protein
VLPAVASTSVIPGLSTPRASASSTMASAIRSLMEPPGLRCSHFTKTGTGSPRAIRPSGTSAVRPMRPRMSSARPCIVVSVSEVRGDSNAPNACRKRRRLDRTPRGF